jgi:hypothetical protein
MPPQFALLDSVFVLQCYSDCRRMPLPDFEGDVHTRLDRVFRLAACNGELCAAEGSIFGLLNAILLQQILSDAKVRAAHAHGLNILPQLLRKDTARLFARVLLYRVVECPTADRMMGVVVERVSPETESRVAARIVREVKRCAYVIALIVRSSAEGQLWLYVISDSYVGIDRMQLIGCRFIPRVADDRIGLLAIPDAPLIWSHRTSGGYS